MKKWLAIVGGLVVLGAAVGAVLVFLKKKSGMQYSCSCDDHSFDDIDDFLEDTTTMDMPFAEKKEELEKTDKPDNTIDTGFTIG